MIEIFSDPITRAPVIGSMLMCLASSLIGVVVFIRRRSLLGEALSHAAYPGVVFSVILASVFFPFSEEIFSVSILVGAFLSSLVGLFVIDWMERRLRVKSDAALCFVLSIFFGVGVLVASRIQITHALWYQKIQIFLYGQTATMTDVHILIYGTLAVLMIGCLALLFRLIEVVHFDREFSEAIGIRARLVDGCVFFLLILAIVIGIRSVGVVLMSGMLIAPAVAARQWSHRLSGIFVIAGALALLSGFGGNFLSLNIPLWFNPSRSKQFLALPTGPMILLTAVALCLFSLLFAPQGVLIRGMRVIRFTFRCRMENILKTFWRHREESLSFSQIAHAHKMPAFVLYVLLMNMRFQGVIKKEGNLFSLTQEGDGEGAKIIRLHRLWELYLVKDMGQGIDKVHRTAEEMEHFFTPELERELTTLLGDPKRDPHEREIPERREK
jgi:manganese/zinc/iron transport system permease protein